MRCQSWFAPENHKNRPDEAEKLFRNALAEDAEIRTPCLQLVTYCTQQRRRSKYRGEKAHANMQKQKRYCARLWRQPCNWNLHSELGIVLAADKLKYDQAEAELRKGVELAPERGAPHAMLAISWSSHESD